METNGMLTGLSTRIKSVKRTRIYDRRLQEEGLRIKILTLSQEQFDKLVAEFK